MLPVVAPPAASRPTGYLPNPYLGLPETSILIALVNSVAPKVMIEVGCQVGSTAHTILRNSPTIERYVGIDVPNHCQPTLPSQRSEVPPIAGLLALVDPRFEVLMRERGSLGLAEGELPRCDAVFIDGDHSEDAVRHDSHLARACVRPGGIIVWHDHSSVHLDSVTRALERLHAEGWPLFAVAGTWLAFLRV